MKHLVSFATGVLFAVGLALAGMTQPHKVVGFLDFTGSWDPSLAFVMGGAVVVYAVLMRLVLRRGAPLLGGAFALPTRRDLSPRLLAGSAMFGVGWGMAGFCPGPALTSVGTLGTGPLIFVVAMSAGMLLHDLVFERIALARTATQPSC